MPPLHVRPHKMNQPQKSRSVMQLEAGGFLEGARAMKDELFENLGQEDYNVHDFYHETGFWQALAKNEKFDHMTLGIISLNAIWIGIDSDHNTKPSGQTDIQFVIADQFFCIFFTFELLTRFLAFASKYNCLKDSWFKFDSALVILMILETWFIPLVVGGGGAGGMGDASMLRLLRLLRLTRMARLMRSAPELVTLLKGMAAAVRSVSSVLVLLILFTYVFAVIFKQQTEGDPVLEEYFGMIPEAMWNLIMAGTLCDNITMVLNLLRERNEVLCGVFLMWVLLSSFTMLNMLIGVLCEVVGAVSASEKEKNAVTFAKTQFLSVLHQVAQASTDGITEAEFEKFVMHADVKAPLDALEVDREHLLGLKDVIFSAKEEREKTLDGPSASALRMSTDTTNPALFSRSSMRQGEEMARQTTDRELSFGELLEKILDLRASNPAMVSHIVDLRKHMKTNQNDTKVFYLEMDSEMEDLKAQHHTIIRNQTQMMQTQMHMVDAIREIQKKLGCCNLVQIPPPDQDSHGQPCTPFETQPTLKLDSSDAPPGCVLPVTIDCNSANEFSSFEMRALATDVRAHQT